MNRKYKIIIIVFSLGIIIFFVFYKNNNDDMEMIMDSSDLNLNIAEEKEEKKTEEDKIKIHITGEVNNQGIIEIEYGERIADAIEKAGGLTIKADVSKVNLAYVLEDGQKLYIPSIEDTNFNEIDSESGENVIINSEQKTGKININSASQEDLQKINGVGPSLAQKIIQYRNSNGKFKNIEDLLNVSGIGEKKFEGIKEFICVK